MSRNTSILVVVVMCALFGAFCVNATRTWATHIPTDVMCADFLRSPREGWFKVKGCVLDVNAMVLESANGEFESLDNRRKGISSKLYDGTPVWVAALIPMTTVMDRGARRAALRSESADLLKWVNAHEVADDLKREKMWDDPSVLNRMAHPSLLVGRAEKPDGDLVPRAFGPAASVNLHVFRVEAPPEQMHVSVVITIALVILLAGIVLVIRFTRGPRNDGDLTPEQVTARNIIGSTKVELGALEELREEERQEQRKKRNG
ncbi:MAG: hypothetical protein QM817_16825 [Archangium sp.]